MVVCAHDGHGRSLTQRMGARRKAVRAGRHAIKRGKTPRYEVDLRNRRVTAMPWLEFDGPRPPEIAEAARRAIAAELQVRPHQVLVEPLAEAFDRR